ncbi:unnamed protein product [Closterium sp. NIES-53]
MLLNPLHLFLLPLPLLHNPYVNDHPAALPERVHAFESERAVVDAVKRTDWHAGREAGGGSRCYLQRWEACAALATGCISRAAAAAADAAAAFAASGWAARQQVVHGGGSRSKNRSM